MSLDSCRNKKKGWTLVEITVVVIVAVLLVTLAVASYIKVISKSEDTEALHNLAAIRKAEFVKQEENGTFVNATNTSDVNEKLATVDVQEKIFRYKVVNATLDDFAAIAERIKGNESVAAKDKPIVIAMYSDGTTSYTYPSGTGSGSGYGGTYGGGFGGGGSSSGTGGGGSGFGLGGGSGGGGGTGGSSGGGSGGTGGTTGDGTTGGGFGTLVSTSGFSGIPIAIGNDGFINLGWQFSLGEPYAFSIYRALASDQPLELLVSDWPGVATFYSDFGLTNDQTYFYRIDAVLSGGATVASSIFKATPSTTSLYAQKSATAFETLAASSHGLELSEKISLYDIPIGFGTGVEGALAWYTPYFNTITLNLTELGNSQNVHAALLAHEGTHGWWNNDLTQGAPLRVSSNSVDQEYHAFLNGADVWNEIKGSESDFDQDGWASVMARGEAQAKEIIRLAYADQGLPEY